MLARSPIAQVWKDDAPHFSRLVENGVTIAVVDRSCGRWDGRVEQCIAPHHSNTTRTTLGGLRGYTSREAAKVAVEDYIDAVRSDDGSAASSDAAALGREALAVGDVRETDDEHHLVAFDVLKQVGTWR